jgi:hypothetical protein
MESSTRPDALSCRAVGLITGAGFSIAACFAAASGTVTSANAGPETSAARPNINANSYAFAIKDRTPEPLQLLQSLSAKVERSFRGNAEFAAGLTFLMPARRWIYSLRAW